VRTSLAIVCFIVACAATAAAPETAYYRIELAPSGSYVAIGAPVTKATMVLFHLYPDGKLMSLRKTDVKKVSPITAKEAAAPAKKDLVSIGNLAMQNGGAPPAAGSGPHASGSSSPSTSAVRATASSMQGPGVVSTHDGLAVSTAAQPPQ
jgi:hypothetical protein